MFETVIYNNLLQILLSIILLFNVGAFKFMWDRIRKDREEIEKNSESINMIINRIFGLDKDPTDEGHLIETQNRFDTFGNKLDDIADRQREAKEERRDEHEEVKEAINFIIDNLHEEDNIDFDGEKL